MHIKLNKHKRLSNKINGGETFEQLCRSKMLPIRIYIFWKGSQIREVVAKASVRQICVDT